MKSKNLLVMNTTKKRAGVALLCGALIATIGAGTVFAANDSAAMLRKVEDGVTIYSTDGGQTWSENAPEGVTAFNGKEGSRGFIRGMRFNGEFNGETGYMMKSKDGAGYMVKVEDGVKLYSTDGGETWSENVPEGMPVFNGKEGIVIRGMDLNDGTGYMMKSKDGEGYMVKVEDGTKLYSTDGGETWSENAPEGMPAFNGKKGTVIRGIGPNDGTGYEMKIRDAAEVI